MEIATKAQAALQAYADKNDKTIHSAFLTDSSLDVDLKAAATIAFDAKDRLVSKTEFINKNLEAHVKQLTKDAVNGGMNPRGAVSWAKQQVVNSGAVKDAEKTYNKIVDKYSEYEKADNGKLVHYSQSPGAAQGTGGLTTKPVDITAQYNNTNQEGTKAILGIGQDIKAGNVEKVVFGSAVDITADVYSGMQDDPAARAVAQTFIDQIQSGEIGSSKTHPVGNVRYVGIAANNPNLVGYEITVPQGVMHEKSLTGTDKNPGLLHGASPLNNKITVFVPANKTTNPLYNSMQSSQEDWILNAPNSKGITVDKYKNAGHFTVVHRQDGGGYKISGSAGYIDASGKVAYKPFNYDDQNEHLNAKTLINNLKLQMATHEELIDKELLHVYDVNKDNKKGDEALAAFNTGMLSQGLTVSQQ